VSLDRGWIYFLALGVWIARLRHLYPDYRADTPSIRLSHHELASGIGSSESAVSRLGKEAPTIGLARIFQGDTGASSWQSVNVIVTWGRAWIRSGSNLLGASCVGSHSEIAVNRRGEECPRSRGTS
jgi:hypothetical protein